MTNRFYYIDKFGDGWGNGLKLAIMDVNHRVGWYSPSTFTYQQFGPLVVFSSKLNKDGDTVNATLIDITGNAAFSWEVL